MKRSSRLATSVLVVCLLAGCAAVLAHRASTNRPGDLHSATGVLGDVDGDGDVTSAERGDLTRSQEAASTLSDQILPTHGVVSLMVTPTGGDWWRLVTSTATTIGLWDVDAPEGVSWFAYAENRGFKPAPAGTYDSISVAFESGAAAEQWVEDLASAGYGGLGYLVRDRVVTITPATVDSRTQPLRAPDETAIADIEVPVGLWSLDISGQVEARAAGSTDPVVFEAAWGYLGFADADSTWTATSANAKDPWVGQITGFDAGDVDLQAAAATLNLSTGPDGLAAVLYEFDARDRDGMTIGAGSYSPDLAPDDVDLALGMSPAYLGAVSGSTARFYPPIRQTTWWIAKDTMAIAASFDDTPLTAGSGES